jgi:excisionase family DNA binding protein
MELCYSDPNTLTRYWRPSQVAHALGVSAESIRRYCKLGKLPARRTAGGSYLIPQRTLNTLQRAVEAQGAAPLHVIVKAAQEELGS